MVRLDCKMRKIGRKCCEKWVYQIRCTHQQKGVVRMKYEEPILEIINFEIANVICTSLNGNGSTSDYEDPWA